MATGILSTEPPEWVALLIKAAATSTSPRPPIALEPPPQSAVERFLTALESHVGEEAEAVEAYRRLGDQTPDPVVRFLLRLVVEDENRHHRVLERMVGSLRSSLTWTPDLDGLPNTSPTSKPAPAESIAAARAFVDLEHEESRELRRLAHEEQRLGGGLYALLLEMMALDSEKHERIMRFIAGRLASTA
jgi:rubrerythrin